MSVVDRLVVRLLPAVQCLQHLILLPRHRISSLSLCGFLSRRAPYLAVARQIEAGEFADHGIAADPGFAGNLAAGQPGFKADFQEFEAFGSPGAFVGGHDDGPKLSSRHCDSLWPTVIRTGAPQTFPFQGSLPFGVLPLSRIDSSPSLMASR